MGRSKTYVNGSTEGGQGGNGERKYTVLRFLNSMKTDITLFEARLLS